MITLTGQFTFERFNVYRDDVNALQFYYMPQGPRIALDETGKPMFSLIMYRRDLSAVPEADRATKLGGGILGRMASTGGGVPQVTPEQAAQVTPDQVQEIAARAEQHDPTVLDKVGGFYAQHPQLVKTLGSAALAIALAGIANRTRR